MEKHVYKQEINEKFLKTVSAFANYEDGDIIFGISDGTIQKENEELIEEFRNYLKEKSLSDKTIKTHTNNV